MSREQGVLLHAGSSRRGQKQSIGTPPPAMLLRLGDKAQSGGFVNVTDLNQKSNSGPVPDATADEDEIDD